MDSIIYSKLQPDVAERCGYFRPKDGYQVLDHRTFFNQQDVTADTQIIYYPGSFGTFHAGHVAVCAAAQARYPDALLVISPANSDYAVEKYGAWSELASNKHRYEAIKRAMPRAVIDVDPMLNMRCDQNFTDLLENYLCAHELSIAEMRTPPIILTGKDRDFSELNNHTDQVKVEYVEDTTGLSTSALENKQRRKKLLYLRVHTWEEFELFKKYFDDQYNGIFPIMLEEERRIAKMKIREHGITHTICKDYADFLPYIKVKRCFKNPLEDSIHAPKDSRFDPSMVILDSDVYSGSTKEFIERQGCEFHAIYDLSGHTSDVELLDIDDFRDPEFNYPKVDISSRCSMQAFDFDFHYHFLAFKSELNHV